ncbi:MAG: GTP-binding protein [Thermoproteota archaeon]|nr:MAG: GTP-binding protein [Candidatus Korarchaeota archaeon]
MPTNLPPQARVKFEEYTQAKTPEEKIKKLKEFYALIPKHKGTEKLEKFIRRRIAELRREVERKRTEKGARRLGPFIKKKGAAQVVLLGYTNSGRSTVLKLLTNARVKISPYPFTTSNPFEGAMRIRGTFIQFIESPPLIPQDYSAKPTKIALALARNADAIALVVDGTESPVESVTGIISLLEANGITIGGDSGKVTIRKSRGISSIIISMKGRVLDGTEADIRALLESYGIKQAIVDIEGTVTMEDVEEAIFGEKMRKPILILVTKTDLKEGMEGFLRVKETFPEMRVYPFSPSNPPDKEELGSDILQLLGIIRVFTKPAGRKEPDEKALILERGSTVIDAAGKIHKSFLKSFKYAKIWSDRLPYSPMRVGKDFVLEDGDVIEIRA